jgi:hypothetical protein
LLARTVTLDATLALHRDPEPFCRCGHRVRDHDDSQGECFDEVWNGEEHGFCMCTGVVIDPKRTQPVAGSR